MNAYARTGAFLVVVTLLCSPAIAERKYSDWGPVVNLGCGIINSASNDQGPAISKDGRSLYFGSDRAGTLGGFDIYVAQRASEGGPWGMPQNLGPGLNSPFTDNIPSFSRDGHVMFFNSNRPGSMGGVEVDIWASYRTHVHDDSAWETPVNLGVGVNTPGFDAGANYFENEEGGAPLLFFGSGPSMALSDIWVAEQLPDGTWGNKRPIPELNSPQQDQRPVVRFDGLEMIFFSNRIGSTPGPTGAPTSDLYVTTRKSLSESWSPPVKLGTQVNTQFNEINPYLSADGETLFFASNRPVELGGCGGNDIYMTTRTKQKVND